METPDAFFARLADLSNEAWWVPALTTHTCDACHLEIMGDTGIQVGLDSLYEVCSHECALALPIMVAKGLQEAA